jgi:hypothetical protein
LSKSTEYNNALNNITNTIGVNMRNEKLNAGASSVSKKLEI